MPLDRYVTKDWGNPAFDKFTETNWRILEAVEAAARDTGKSAAQVPFQGMIHGGVAVDRWRAE